MTNFINKFKIPTFLGLAIIFAGIGAGVYLTLKEQIFFSQAAPNLTPQNVTLTNIMDDSAVISWQTSSAAVSFLIYGQKSPNEQTALDDRDTTTPTSRTIHYVTLKKLLPKTQYQFKIVSGKLNSDISKFTTAPPATTQSGFAPVIGTVLDTTTPLNDGIVYLSIAGASIQSSLIKTSGNFVIPITQVRKDDLSDIYSLSEDSTAKLTIISDKGRATALFKIKASSQPLPPIKLGENVDLTIPESVIPSVQTATPSAQELSKFDLNGDGKINDIDYAIILQNFGKNPKNKKADVDGDGIVDEKDLNLMINELRKLSSK